MTGTLTWWPELTDDQRCDRCGAAAKVCAVLSFGSELLFCAHHGRTHKSKLLEIGAHLQWSP
jgi:hypothetical protein